MSEVTAKQEKTSEKWGDSTWTRRAALGGVALNGLLLLAALVVYLAFNQDAELPFAGPWYITALVYGALSLLILSRYPGHTVGWLYLFVGLAAAITTLEVYGLNPYWPEPAAPAARSAGWIILGVATGASWLLTQFGSTILVLLYFPDGRLPSPRWRIVLLLTVVGMLTTLAGSAVQSLELAENGALGEILFSVGTGLLGLAILGSLASMVVRYLRSAGVRRQQIKWLAYTAVVTIVPLFLMAWLLGSDNQFLSYYSLLVPSFLAAAVAVAILRYGLYNIDIIIRRTLQYGLVTAILALVYFGLVVFLQSVFVSGGAQQSDAAIVISTLVIAALFNPLRRRVQNAVDRRFYRQKVDAAQALNRFAEASRDEVDVGRLVAAMVRVVEETMQPAGVSVWLMPDEDRQL